MFSKSGCLKIVIAFSAFVLFAIGYIYFKYNEKMPIGDQGPAAEQLAEKMLTAINNDAWNEVNYIAWNFADRQQYLWDKQRHLVKVKWAETEVLLDPSEITGVAYINGEKVADDTSKKTVKQAWDFFNNDSFWLNAPALVNQPGTKRSIVKTEDGDKQLMVTYTSGGTTPGDSYLWKLDANGRPLSYKMWVNIIPIGGLEFTWEDWTDVGKGAMVSTTHVSPMFTLQLKDIKTGDSYTDFGMEADPFSELIRKKSSTPKVPTTQSIN